MGDLDRLQLQEITYPFNIQERLGAQNSIGRHLKT